MIAIDTNVLLRYVLQDDRDQASAAAALIQGGDLVLVADTVLVETIWTLKGKKYNQEKAALVSVIEALFEEPNICFEDDQSVWRALSEYRAAKPLKGKEADFSDALILNKSRAIATRRGHSFGGFYTFDQAAQTLAGAKAPA